jgi:hydrogenase maturation protease
VPDRPRAAVLVAGLGNEMRRDDAVGILVARELRARQAAHGIEVRERPGEPIALLDDWPGCDAAVLVDAMRSGAAPGTVARLDASGDRLVETLSCAASTHAISLAETLELAAALDRLPSRVIVYAVEGRDFTVGNQLSPEVHAALPDVTDAVLREARRLRQIVGGYCASNQ